MCAWEHRPRPDSPACLFVSVGVGPGTVTWEVSAGSVRGPATESAEEALGLGPGW